MSKAKLVRLRKNLRMSQRLFAAALNVSPKLVQSWEQGTRQPNGGNLRLLQLVQNQPKLIDELCRQDRHPSQS